MHAKKIKNMSNKEVESLILKKIEQQECSDQQELLAKLAEEGIILTQSTLSRRLKRLGIGKHNGVYARTLASKIKSGFVHSVALAPPNLMVIHTPPGHAQALAFQLDVLSKSDQETTRDDLNKVLGTIAGDDTVLVITVGVKELYQIQARIEKEFS